jgi:hypothetical protein
METKTDEQHRKDLEEIAKAMGGNLITVNVQLFEPYVKFAKEYMEFFNVKETFEIFCMRLIYHELERLHRNLTGFVEDKDQESFIHGTDWYNKNPHIACTATQPDDEQETD